MMFGLSLGIGRLGGKDRPLPPSAIPPLALTFSDRTPLQFSNGAYLETAA